MPTPISSDSGPYIAPSLDADATCDPTAMSCADADTPTSVPATATITTDPVCITGELGTRELVARYESAREPGDCSAETRNAILACAAAGATALTSVASAATVVGLIGGVSATFLAGANCGREVALLDACKAR